MLLKGRLKVGEKMINLLDIKWWILFAIVGFLLFVLINRSLKKPLKWIGMGFLYSAVGAVILLVLNWMGQWVSLQLPINPVTAFITGFLGLPGILYLVIVKVLFIG